MKRIQKTIIAIMIIAFLSATSLLTTSDQSTENPIIPANISSYVSHTPITIIGNSQFTDANGVASGSGISSDPYIIEGWEINTWTADGIHIGNTQAYLIIRNCHSYATSIPTSHAAIYLDNCTHVTIRDNNCSYQDFGIYLHQSSGNTIVNNTCSRFVGIYLEASSDHNVIEKNNCSNSYNGITLYYSSNNNTVRENKCSNDVYGISLYESDNNSISDNTCNNNHGSGLFEEPCAISLNRSANNTLSNNSCQNNDRGIQLSSHSTHNTIINNSCGEGLYGNLVLGYDCDSNSLIHNNCTGSGDGITIFSSGNRIDNNSCSENNRGIYFGHRGSFLAYIEVTSYDNIVCNNWLSNNNQYGIEISHASNNLVWNNTFIGNNGATNIYNSSHAQAYDDGSNNHWNSSGYGNYWSDWTGSSDPYVIEGSAGAKDYHPLGAAGTSGNLMLYGAIVAIIVVIIVAVLVIMMRKKKESVRKNDDTSSTALPDRIPGPLYPVEEQSERALSSVTQTQAQRPSIAVQRRKIPRKVVAQIFIIVAVSATLTICGFLLYQTRLSIQVWNDAGSYDIAVGIYVDQGRVALQVIKPGQSFSLSMIIGTGKHLVGIDFAQWFTSNLDGVIGESWNAYVGLGATTSINVHYPHGPS